MDQDNTPKFDSEPYQPSPTGPDQPPVPGGGAQVYGENFQPTPGATFSPPPPTYGAPPPPPKSNNRRIWIIILVVVLVLCCCCLIALVVAWITGDSVILQMCAQDPTLPFCQP